MEKIQRVTERGQITLPVAWRRKIGVAKTIILRIDGDRIEISPLRTQDDRDDEWITLFDAMRDNKGKGITAEKFIAVLEKNLERKKHGRIR